VVVYTVTCTTVSAIQRFACRLLVPLVVLLVWVVLGLDDWGVVRPGEAYLLVDDMDLLVVADCAVY
jgi:hypothetical protein